MTERSPAHPQRDAVLQASQQARANGRLIRMTVTTAGGLHRLVVTPMAVSYRWTSQATAETPRAEDSTVKPPQNVSASWTGSPCPSVRWAGLALGVLTAVALVVIVVHGRTPAAAATGAHRGTSTARRPAVHRAAAVGLVTAGPHGSSRSPPGLSRSPTRRPRSPSRSPRRPDHDGDPRTTRGPEGPVALGAGTGRADPPRRRPGRPAGGRTTA